MNFILLDTTATLELVTLYKEQ